MIDWATKLTSRKFWMAIVGLVSGLLMAFKVDAETVETISGVVMSMASVIAYIIGEGLADAAGANAAGAAMIADALDACEYEDDDETAVEETDAVG